MSDPTVYGCARCHKVITGKRHELPARGWEGDHSYPFLRIEILCDECVAPRPVAVQPEASPPTATVADDLRLLKAENESLRRERDALRAALGDIASKASLGEIWIRQRVAAALASETGGASTKKSGERR